MIYYSQQIFLGSRRRLRLRSRRKGRIGAYSARQSEGSIDVEEDDGIGNWALVERGIVYSCHCKDLGVCEDGNE